MEKLYTTRQAAEYLDLSPLSPHVRRFRHVPVSILPHSRVVPAPSRKAPCEALTGLTCAGLGWRLQEYSALLSCSSS